MHVESPENRSRGLGNGFLSQSRAENRHQPPQATTAPSLPQNQALAAGAGSNALGPAFAEEKSAGDLISHIRDFLFRPERLKEMFLARRKVLDSLESESSAVSQTREVFGPSPKKASELKGNWLGGGTVQRGK